MLFFKKFNMLPFELNTCAANLTSDTNIKKSINCCGQNTYINSKYEFNSKLLLFETDILKQEHKFFFKKPKYNFTYKEFFFKYPNGLLQVPYNPLTECS